MKKILPLIILFFSLSLYGQHPSTNIVDQQKYGSPTKWSCIDKHFGYYFTSFSLSIPIKSGIDNSIRSGNFKLGYTYRYKISKPVDIGLELAYSNRYSGIKKDSTNIFDPTGIYNANKIKTFHNSIEGGLYFRFNLGGSTYRKLGKYIDIGGFYNYAFNYGTLYKIKNNSLKQKTRFKSPNYLSPDNYGVYVRFGWNYMSLICSYDFGNWIDNFSNKNLNFSRSNLMLGIQFNLFAR